MSWPFLVDDALLTQELKRYALAWGVQVGCWDAAGQSPSAAQPALAARALRLSLTHGEPIVCGDEELVWALPVQCNQRVLGGIVAWGEAERLLPEIGQARLPQALAALSDVGRRLNLCNQAEQAHQRALQAAERRRAEAIHAAKTGGHRSLLQTYVEREPALLAAARAGKRQEARSLVNEILVAYYHAGGRDEALLRALFVELVSMLGRAAIADGAVPEAVYGENGSLFQDLHAARDEEALGAWLSSRLEALLDAIARAATKPGRALWDILLEEIPEHLDNPDLDRATLAAVLGVSVEAVSKLVHEHAGKDVLEWLGGLRIERAQRLLRGGAENMLAVALDCGFKDPSYFTKVFRRHTGCTPSVWRRLHA